MRTITIPWKPQQTCEYQPQEQSVRRFRGLHNPSDQKRRVPNGFRRLEVRQPRGQDHHQRPPDGRRQKTYDHGGPLHLVVDQHLAAEGQLTQQQQPLARVADPHAVERPQLQRHRSQPQTDFQRVPHRCQRDVPLVQPTSLPRRPSVLFRILIILQPQFGRVQPLVLGGHQMPQQ